MQTRTLKALAIVGMASVFAGCSSSDSPVAPRLRQSGVAFDHGGSSGGSSVRYVNGLGRATPVAAGLQTSGTFGPAGGTLTLPSTGATLIIPPGALLSTTTITMTAHPGSYVAYDFAPHGIRFSVPLTLMQDLRGTHAQPGGSVRPSSLYLGYYQDPSYPTAVSEQLGIKLSGDYTFAAASIWHFSGYIFASGRSDGDGSGDGGW